MQQYGHLVVVALKVFEQDLKRFAVLYGACLAGFGVALVILLDEDDGAGAGGKEGGDGLQLFVGAIVRMVSASVRRRREEEGPEPPEEGAPLALHVPLQDHIAFPPPPLF